MLTVAQINSKAKTNSLHKHSRRDASCRQSQAPPTPNPSVCHPATLDLNKPLPPVSPQRKRSQKRLSKVIKKAYSPKLISSRVPTVFVDTSALTPSSSLQLDAPSPNHATADSRTTKCRSNLKVPSATARPSHSTPTTVNLQSRLSPRQSCSPKQTQYRSFGDTSARNRQTPYYVEILQILEQQDREVRAETARVARSIRELRRNMRKARREFGRNGENAEGLTSPEVI